jgi:hypothetical protein
MNSDCLGLARDAISAIPFRWAPGEEPAAFLNVIDYVTLSIDDAVDLLVHSRFSPVGVHNYEAEQRDADHSPAAGAESTVEAPFGTITIMANPWTRRPVQESAKTVEALVGRTSLAAGTMGPLLATGLKRLSGPFKNAASLRHRVGMEFTPATDLWREIFAPARERLDGLGIAHSFITRFPAATRGEWTLCQSRDTGGQMLFECVQNPTLEALSLRCFRTGLLQHAGSGHAGRQLLVPVHYQGVAWAVVALEVSDTMGDWTRAFYLYREYALFDSIRARTRLTQFELLEGVRKESAGRQPGRSTATAKRDELLRLMFPSPYFGHRSADDLTIVGDEDGPFQKSGMVLPVKSDALWAAVNRASIQKRARGSTAAQVLPPYVLLWSGDAEKPDLRVVAKRSPTGTEVALDHEQDVAVLLALIARKQYGTGLVVKEDIEKYRFRSRPKATTSERIVQAVRRSLKEKGIDPKALLKAVNRTGVRLQGDVRIKKRDGTHTPFGGMLDEAKVMSDEDEDRWRTKMYPVKRRQALMRPHKSR